MLVSVLEATTLLSGNPGPLLITADGLCGWGHWQGADRPAAGDQVDVDLRTDDEISWEKDVLTDFPAGLPQDPAPGRMFLSGRVHDIDRFGVLTLELPKGVFSVELSGSALSPSVSTSSPGIVGSEIRVIARGVGIYPSQS